MRDHTVLPANHTFIHKWDEPSTCLYSPAAGRHRTLTGTHFPSRWGYKAELTWVAGYKPRWFTRRRRPPISRLITYIFYTAQTDWDSFSVLLRTTLRSRWCSWSAVCVCSNESSRRKRPLAQILGKEIRPNPNYIKFEGHVMDQSSVQEEKRSYFEVKVEVKVGKGVLSRQLQVVAFLVSRSCFSLILCSVLLS